MRRLIWQVGGVDLLISPDTGALHIAHALGVPVIGLYGNTDPRLVGPYRRYHDLLINRYPGSEAERAGLRLGHSDPRIANIQVADVLEKVELAGSRYGTGRRRRKMLSPGLRVEHAGTIA